MDSKRELCQHETTINQENDIPDEEGIKFMWCLDCDAELWYHFYRPDILTVVEYL